MTSIEPELWVNRADRAVAFYQAAVGGTPQSPEHPKCSTRYAARSGHSPQARRCINQPVAQTVRRLTFRDRHNGQGRAAAPHRHGQRRPAMHQACRTLYLTMRDGFGFMRQAETYSPSDRRRVVTGDCYAANDAKSF